MNKQELFSEQVSAYGSLLELTYKSKEAQIEFWTKMTPVAIPEELKEEWESWCKYACSFITLPEIPEKFLPYWDPWGGMLEECIQLDRLSTHGIVSSFLNVEKELPLESQRFWRSYFAPFFEEFGSPVPLQIVKDVYEGIVNEDAPRNFN